MFELLRVIRISYNAKERLEYGVRRTRVVCAVELSYCCVSSSFVVVGVVVVVSFFFILSPIQFVAAMCMQFALSISQMCTTILCISSISTYLALVAADSSSCKSLEMFLQMKTNIL